MRFYDYANRLSAARSPKRGRKERLGLAAWHPYYAGYSSDFVEDVLRPLVETHGALDAVVLDPWNGSGTTTMVAQRMGWPSIGLDINPVMVIFAKAKSRTILKDQGAIRNAAANAVRQGRSMMASLDIAGEPLLNWMAHGTLRALVAIRRAILQGEAESPGYEQLLAGATVGSAKARPFYRESVAFLFAALFRVLREVGGFGAGSNPTWVKPSDDEVMTPPEEVFSRFEVLVDQMLGELARPSGGKTPAAQVFEGKSQSIPLPGNSVDIIVTSPPYCTRIDYAVSTKPELLFLGLAEETEFDQIRRGTMGAPVIRDKTIKPRRAWGKTCLSLVDKIEKHPAKASKSYYLPTFLQYFLDAEQSVREILRVLKPGGRAAIVVQSSYFKEHEVPLGQVYVEMVRAVGHVATIARREVVKNHMAHVNTKSSEYQANKVFYEDVVLVQKLICRHAGKVENPRRFKKVGGRSLRNR